MLQKAALAHHRSDGPGCYEGHLTASCAAHGLPCLCLRAVPPPRNRYRRIFGLHPFCSTGHAALSARLEMQNRGGPRPSSRAFCVPFLLAASPRSPSPICSRRPYVASLDWQLSALPVGSIIAAGVSMGILAATFENMLNVLHKRRGVVISDDELCAYCSGFGNVRCEVCNSRGAVFVGVTYFQRVCPACNGKKREKCRRCAGSGKSGMKKSQIQLEEQPSDQSLQ